MISMVRILRLALWLVLLPLCTLSFAPPPARAADEGQSTGQRGVAAVQAEAAGSVGRREQLEEIVVTATRREESLSKVPISLTALTQDTMDEKGIRDILDIVRFTPGVSIDTSGTNAISIRGISSSGGAGTTGIYIDDTPIQMRAVGYNPDDTLPKTFDLERVEVLRGPQGTLFGSGSEGGTVRYILTQPSVTGSSTYARGELSFTRYGQPSYEAGMAYGAPIVDGTLGFRASAWYREDGGWINRADPTTHLVTEHNINRAGALMLRLAAKWQPVEELTVTPSVLYQNLKKHDESTYWPAYSNPDAGQFNTGTPEQMPVNDEYYLPALKIQWNMGRTQLISNTSYYHRKERTAYQGTVYDLGLYQTFGWPANPSSGGLGCGSASVTSTPPCSWYPLIDANGIHLPAGLSGYQSPNIMTNTQESWVQEVRWQSNDPAARVGWTLGVFWQLAKEGSIEELRDTQVNQLFQALYGINATDLFGPYYSCNGQGTPYPAIPACDVYYNNTTTFDRQLAGYGELTFALTERWKLTLGERVARTSFSLNHYADGIQNYGASPATASQHETPNTPKASLAWQMDASDLFYATYAKGFRVGGGNAPLPPYCDADLATAGYPNGAPLTYHSDYTQSYELGSKNSIGQVLKLATSVYYIKWHNIQQSVYVAGSCGLQFTDNLGTAVIKGFDVQAQLALGPVLIDAAAGYTKARYSEDSPHAGLAHSGDAISGEAAIDYAPGLTPPWTVSLGAQYAFSLAEHEAFVRADWEYESRNPWPSTLQDPASSQYNPSTYTLSSNTFTSVRAGMNFGNWLLAAFVDNVFDSHTVTNYQLGAADPYNPASAPPVQQNQFTFRPRTIGVTATVHIGGGAH